MFRPYWPPIDDPKAVSFDVAARLKDAGFRGSGAICRLGWGKRGEDDFFRLYPVEEGADDLLPAPSFSELCAYYLEDGTLGFFSLAARRCDYLAVDEKFERVASTPDDALGELVLARLGDTRYTRV